MYCPECGIENEENSMFCAQCGARLQGESEQSIENDVSEPRKGNLSGMTEKAKEKMNTFSKIILVEIIVFAVVIFGCTSYAKKLFGPEYFAEEYFKALSKGDVNVVYHNLDVEETPFLCKDMFQKYADIWNDSNVTNYKVVCQNNSMLEDNYVTADIVYRTKNAQDDMNFSIQLEKQTKKKYFLFDSWKVQSGSLIINEYYLYVPTGASVTVGGILLDDSYIRQTEDDSGQTEYCINGIFQGVYDIKVTKEGMEDYNGLIYVGTDENLFYLEYMNYKDETILMLQKQAGEFAKSCLMALAEKKSFQTIQSFVSTNEETMEEVKDTYNNMLDSRNYIIRMKKMKVYDITSSVSDIYSNQICFKVDYEYTQEYTEEDWFGEQGDTTDDLSGSMSISYIQENGNWVVSNISEY